LIWEALTADSARTDLGLKIGEDVQAYDEDLQEYSRFMIDDVGANGQFWSSDGDERGKWRTFSENFIITDTTLTIKTGANAGDIVELEIGAKLPEVDGSQLLELNAHQLNDSTVSDDEFNTLAGVRTLSGIDGPGGPIQIQLDSKAQNGQNSDITEITGLTTMLAVNQGGTGAPNADSARVNLGLVIGQHVQEQSVHLQDLADDGILDWERVENGEFFIDEPGQPDFVWTSDGTDRGEWRDGGDISYVKTDDGRGLIITDSHDGTDGYYAAVGTAFVNIDAGSAEFQIPRLVNSGKWEGGALPVADGSKLLYLTAGQLNDGIVSDSQYIQLQTIRLKDDNPPFSYGLIQDQLDQKQKQSDFLDQIHTVSGSADNNDLLIYQESDNSWKLLTESTGEVTKSRVEFGDFFINDVGVNGQFWSSDGLKEGRWRSLSSHFIIDDDSLTIRTGTNG
jgi:hypothetical protein